MNEYAWVLWMLGVFATCQMVGLVLLALQVRGARRVTVESQRITRAVGALVLEWQWATRATQRPTGGG
jgi:hypothetical protein